MTAKCNIIDSVLAKLESVKYGISFFEGTSIIENYAEYLKCSTIDFKPCHLSDCAYDDANGSVPIDHICSLSIGNIKQTEVEGQTSDQLALTIDDIYLVEGHTYQWTFDEDFFTTESTDEPILLITKRPGIDLTTIVAVVSLEITDSEDCVVSKTCYYNYDRGINCLPYTICPNARILSVTMNAIACERNNSLVVTHV